jgi:Flp pilus assembly protein TadG
MSGHDHRRTLFPGRRRPARCWRLARRRESGQVFPLVVVMMTGLIGMLAFTVDVGSWYQNHRSMQAIADAAALAGAEDLPYDTTGATALAASYAAKNGGPTPLVSFPTQNTIQVTIQHQAPGYFSSIYSKANSQIQISAEAQAQAQQVSQADGAVPLVVSSTQPELTGCNGLPCFGTSVTLKVNSDTTLGGGQMGLIDLSTNVNGSVTSQQIADWVTNGLTTPMPANQYYYSAGSCKFSNQNFHAALDTKITAGAPLLFPVYDPTRTDTSTNPPRYWIVGWAAIVITSYRLNGCGNKSDQLQGYFVHNITQGTSDGTATPDYGVRVIALTG